RVDGIDGEVPRHGTSLARLDPRDKEQLRLRALGPLDLLAHAADRPDVPVDRDLARPGDHTPVCDVGRAQEVDDADGEHEAGGRTADLARVDLDRERQVDVRNVIDADAHDGVRR